ncbi:hypothetical protein TRICI_006522 [Trichomonascus ciferrii]|uniref:Beta-catenin-like protein 1 N-terminal domain-containing protein n=1 Tax=Trichomonascus ciferrii TaxID=44093 RepID=A0A6A1LTH1_9ASCO|nr:hypothetical protein TRICI_006522 [Trichomonascus ciferrii]
MGEAFEDSRKQPKYNPEDEDEDGTFYKEGLDEPTRRAFEYVDAQDKKNDLEPEKYNKAYLKRLLTAVEKNFALNTDQRLKYKDEPLKFMDSEHQLHGSIKMLSVLSETDLYQELIDSGSIPTIVELISHEDDLIAQETVIVLSDLFDDSQVVSSYENREKLADSLIEQGLLSTLSSFLQRFSENPDSEDAVPVYDFLDNLVTLESVPTKILTEQGLINTLVSRIADSRSADKSPSKLTSAELLFVLLLANPSKITGLVTDVVVSQKGFVDILLTEVSKIRSISPRNTSEEEEFYENMFNILCLVVRNTAGKDSFADNEGVELMVILMKVSKWAKSRALKVLVDASKGYSAGVIAENIVQSGGLKPLFSLFAKTEDRSVLSNILWVLSSLLRWLDIDSPERIRVIGKFLEKEGAKLRKTVTLRANLRKSVDAIKADISRERKSMESDTDIDEDTILQFETASDARLVEAGLEMLQNIDIILLWLYIDGGETKTMVLTMLDQNDQSLENIKSTINSYISSLKPLTDTQPADTDHELLEAVREAREYVEMLQALHDY